MRKTRVLVALSGGVDSSVAALRLIEDGYDVVGATMQVWDYSSCNVVEGQGTCCSSVDVDDARSVCDHLKIPFYVINCEEEFRTKVVEPFIHSYLKGQTPLPCANCNTFLKFEYLVQKMNELECDYLATGHYAQIRENENGEKRIWISEDDWKDQTYFLFQVDPKIVSRLLFPVGHLKKPEVRQIAEIKGLHRVFKKRDSTGICFVGNRSYVDFLEAEVPAEKLNANPGKIRRSPTGEVVGEHRGIHNFTIGQSKRLGFDHHEKLYVVRMDPAAREVWVGDEAELYAEQCWIDRTSFFEKPAVGDRVQIKIRSQHKASDAIVEAEDLEHGRVSLRFEKAQRSITPGQAAVFYKDQFLLGGGWICEV